MTVPRESPEFCETIITAARQFIPDDRLFTIVQVGCLDGYEGLYVKKGMKNCTRVVGFEANPYAKILEGVEPRRVAIGHYNGQGMLTAADQAGLSSLKDRGGHKLFVEVMRLDDALAPSPQCDLLIIDVEGTLLDVLAGGPETLNQARLVVAEVTNEQRAEAEKILAAHGLTFMEGYGYSAGSQANWFYGRTNGRT